MERIALPIIYQDIPSPIIYRDIPPPSMSWASIPIATTSADDGRCVACHHTECGCPCATCMEQAKRIDLLGSFRPICQCHSCDRVRRLHRHQAAVGVPPSPKPGRCEGCGAALGHESMRATEYSALLEPGTIYSVITAVACAEACRESALDAAAARVGARRRR